MLRRKKNIVALILTCLLTLTSFNAYAASDNSIQEESNKKEDTKFIIDGLVYDKDNMPVKYTGETISFMTCDIKACGLNLYINGEKVDSTPEHLGNGNLSWTPDKAGEYNVKITLGTNDQYSYDQFTIKVIDKDKRAPKITSFTRSYDMKDDKNNLKFSVTGDNIDSNTKFKYYIRYNRQELPGYCGGTNKPGTYKELDETDSKDFECYLDPQEIGSDSSGYYTSYEVMVVAENQYGTDSTSSIIKNLADMKVSINNEDLSDYVYQTGYNSNCIYQNDHENINIVVEGKYKKYSLYIDGRLYKEQADSNVFNVSDFDSENVYQTYTVEGLCDNGKIERRDFLINYNNSAHIYNSDCPVMDEVICQNSLIGSDKNTMYYVKDKEDAEYKFDLVKKYDYENDNKIYKLPETTLLKDFSKSNYVEYDFKDDDYKTSNKDLDYRYYIKVTARKGEVATKYYEIAPASDENDGGDQTPQVRYFKGAAINDIYYESPDLEGNTVLDVTEGKENSIKVAGYDISSVESYKINDSEPVKVEDSDIKVTFDKRGDNLFQIISGTKDTLNLKFNVLKDYTKTSLKINGKEVNDGDVIELNNNTAHFEAEDGYKSYFLDINDKTAACPSNYKFSYTFPEEGGEFKCRVRSWQNGDEAEKTVTIKLPVNEKITTDTPADDVTTDTPGNDVTTGTPAADDNKASDTSKENISTKTPEGFGNIDIVDIGTAENEVAEKNNIPDSEVKEKVDDEDVNGTIEQKDQNDQNDGNGQASGDANSIAVLLGFISISGAALFKRKRK